MSVPSASSRTGKHRAVTAATTGRHRGAPRRPLSVAGSAAATVTGGAVVTGTLLLTAGPALADADPGAMAKLRQCESGGNYAINTGNGYYGAYQFDAGTWRGLGYSGLPNQASPATQDAAAQKLYNARGWAPWPGCSRALNLRGYAPVPAAAPAPAPRPVPAPAQVVAPAAPKAPAAAPTPPAPAPKSPAPAPAIQVVPPAATAPEFSGEVVTTAAIGEVRADVTTWQQRMSDRGWIIAVDGRFGPQSASVAARFGAEKNVVDGLPGQLGQNVWTAAWAAPIT